MRGCADGVGGDGLMRVSILTFVDSFIFSSYVNPLSLILQKVTTQPCQQLN